MQAEDRGEVECRLASAAHDNPTDAGRLTEAAGDPEIDQPDVIATNQQVRRFSIATSGGVRQSWQSAIYPCDRGNALAAPGSAVVEGIRH